MINDFKPLLLVRPPKGYRRLLALVAGITLVCLGAGIEAYFSESPQKPMRSTPTTGIDPFSTHLEPYLPPSESLPASVAKKESQQDQKKVVAVQSGDTLSEIFSRLRLPKTLLHQILTIDGVEESLSSLQPGQKIFFLLNADNSFKQLKYSVSETNTLVVHYQEGEFKTESLFTPTQKKYKYREGAIENSLYETASDAGLSDKAISQLTEIFRWDIDFALDLQAGDSFKVIQEEIIQNGKKVRDGHIVAAEFINQGQRFRAVRYTDRNGFARYYSPEGQSLQKSFLRAPVQFTRISSHFSSGRRHPILHRMRAHKGVDYAAPIGTPVKAAGDGKIEFSGRKGGYGNTLVIAHDKKHSTLYAHLSRFAKGIKPGTEVFQGQVIGYVGVSGLTTGAHLHYEFLINDVHRNPLTVALPDSSPIPSIEKARFKKQTAFLLSELAKQAGTVAFNQ